MGRACSTYKGEKINYRVAVGYPVEKRTLGRKSHKWEENIKKYLRKIK